MIPVVNSDCNWQVCEAVTSYYDINSMVYDYYINKSVWLAVEGEKFYLEKEPGNLYNNLCSGNH